LYEQTEKGGFDAKETMNPNAAFECPVPRKNAPVDLRGRVWFFVSSERQVVGWGLAGEDDLVDRVDLP